MAGLVAVHSAPAVPLLNAGDSAPSVRASSGCAKPLATPFKGKALRSSSARDQKHGNRSHLLQARAEAASSAPSKPTEYASPQVSKGQSEGHEEIPGVRHTAWDQQDLQAKYPKLDQDLNADVVVVGAGIAGLSVAYNLVKAGKNVVVLEGRVIGSGQTGRTTAHIMPWNDDYYMMIAKNYGEDNAFLVGDSHRKAIDFIFKTVENEGIDCELERVDGYLVPHIEEDKSVMEMLLSEYEASKKAGFDVSLVDMHQDPSLGKWSQGVKFPGGGDFHPLKYIQGLADAITKMGGKIYENSRVKEQDGNKVTTFEGKSLTGGAVVLATNSPIHSNLAVHARQPPSRSYVVGFKVKKGDIQRAQWWDTLSPYHYARIESKPDFDVLILGGEDHPSGLLQPDEYPPAFENLEKYGRAHWPVGEVIYKWTGQLYEPVDFLHFYSHNPLDLSNTYIATGDSGQGMTGGTLAGIIISDLILGRPNPWASLYDADRPPPPTLEVGQAVIEPVLATAQGYANNLPLLGSEFTSVEGIANKSGAVVNIGLKKVAVYKDESGIAHQFSAVCPHLECAVKWNPSDSTFDCPCHGSQFDTKGRCIQGPSTADLPSLS